MSAFTAVGRAREGLETAPDTVRIAVLAAGAVAIAALPPPFNFAAALTLGALASLVWLELGYTLYVVALHFVIGIKRFFASAPLGLALDGLMVLMLVGLALRLCRTERAEARRWLTPMVGVALVYEFYNIVNAFNPNTLNYVFSVYAVRMAIPEIVLFVLAVFLLGTPRRVYVFMGIWCASIVGVALWAIKQQLLGFHWREVAWMYSPDGTIWRTADGVIRVFGSLAPDALGILTAYALIVSFTLLFAPIRPLLRLLLLTLMPIFGLALLYSGTRSAYAAALVGLAIVIVLLRRKWLWALSVILPALLAGAIDWSSDYWGKRVSSLFNPQSDSSFQVRYEIIGDHLDEALYRAFGNGTETTSYASFAKEMLKEAKENGALLATGIDIPTDNSYFMTLLEGGVVGVVLLLLVVVAVGLTVARQMLTFRNGTLRMIALGFFGCHMGAVVASFSNNYLHLFATWVLFGLIGALEAIRAEEARAWAALHEPPAAPAPLTAPPRLAFDPAD